MNRNRNALPCREIVEHLKRSYARGTRVELVRMNDPYTQVPTGTKGNGHMRGRRRNDILRLGQRGKAGRSLQRGLHQESIRPAQNNIKRLRDSRRFNLCTKNRLKLC